MKEAGRCLWDLRTPMRDGIELSTDLYLPEAGLTGGPYPLVLLRTPDNNQHSVPVGYARHLSDSGVAVALQDVRGRHDSQGVFTPFRDEGRDGHDSVEWFAAQEWCTGRVGMMGGGYAAWAQWAAAAERPPHLVTLVSTSPMCGPYDAGLLRLPMLAWLHKTAARVWQEGSQVDWDAVFWSLPLRDMDRGVGRDLPAWHAWLDAPWADPTALDVGAVDLPVLHVTGWYDDARARALRLYGQLRDRPDQCVLIGPWDEAGSTAPQRSLGGVDFGADATPDLRDVHLSWFDRWLNDGSAGHPGARVFVTGLGEWRDRDAWPTSAPAATYHLRSQGRLTSQQPGEEPPDCYDYDPSDPVVVTSDFRFQPTPPARPVEPPLDRRFVERRADVLVYSTEELADDLEVLGTPAVRLFVASDRLDTDWVVQLTDVSPRGTSTSVAGGALRARYRDTTEQLTNPGASYEISVDLGPVAHVFRRGHRVRLSVTSSWFPLYSRNLNTGGPIADEREPLVARNEVFHDPARPSALLLPVVEAPDA